MFHQIVFSHDASHLIFLCFPLIFIELALAHMCTPEGLERGLEALDALPERDTHIVWLLFARDRKYDEPTASAANNNSSSSYSAGSTRANLAKGSHPPLPPIEVIGRDGAWWATSQSFADAAAAAAASAGLSEDSTGNGSGGGVGGGDSAVHHATSSSSPSSKTKKGKTSYSVSEAAAARAAGAAWAQAELPPDWHVFLAGAAEEPLNNNSGGNSGNSGNSGGELSEREGMLGVARSGVGLGQAMDPSRHLGNEMA